MDIIRHGTSPLLSRAVVHGGHIQLCGIVAKDLDGDIKAQTLDVLTQIDQLLAQCGSDRTCVTSALIFVSDIRNRAPLNEVWTAWADAAHMPARTCVQAALGDPQALVEVTASAVVR